jgi:CPA2 family monovalent cation:H+ antiporter-2
MDLLAVGTATSDPLQAILNLAVAVGAALIGGTIAVRLRQPAVVGYLLAGVAIGPFTPGFAGDIEQIAILAEIGVVLLLFALGVEFSLDELVRVRRVVVPGAIVQIVTILLLGAAVALGFGLDPAAAVVIGACVSISSTLVVLKALLDRGEMDSLHGRTAIGWMILQDIATIVFMVALPPLAGGDPVGPFLLALLKAGIFLVLAYVVGTRLLPWLFAAIARLGSQELFLLAVFSTALIAAVLANVIFGLSLALGAFVAGLLVSGSALSYQAAAEVIPFRDLFAVLFFVSVGMLMDPAALIDQAPLVAVLVVLAVVVKSVVTGGLGRLLGMPLRSAILLGGLVGQVGEFSFILAEDALQLGIIDGAAYNLVLGTAGISIVISPFVMRGTTAAVVRRARTITTSSAADVAGPAEGPEAGEVPGLAGAAAQAGGEPALEAGAAVVAITTDGIEPEPPIAGGGERSRGERAGELGPDEARASIVVLGAGRVGSRVIRAARGRGFRCVAIDRDQRRLDAAAKLGAATLYGDAASPAILRRAGLDRARVLVVAVGDPLTARLAIERAKVINPRIQVASRARGRAETERLRSYGVGRIADPEVEAGLELARHALQRMGVSGPELQAILVGLRRDAYGR